MNTKIVMDGIWILVCEKANIAACSYIYSEFCHSLHRNYVGTR